MRVNEVFLSCQGEGSSAGLPTLFVRAQGCNLFPDRCCKYCDTTYSQVSFSMDTNFRGRDYIDSELLTAIEVKSKGCRRVCITGGEPLFQEPAVKSLVDLLNFREYEHIEVFTNGTLPPPDWLYMINSWVVDIKCPSSGVRSREEQWIGVLRRQDSLKLTVGDFSDLQFAAEILKKYQPISHIIVSPVLPNCPNSQFGEILMSHRRWLETVWEFCISNRCRFSFQLHKLVFGNKKGV